MNESNARPAGQAPAKRIGLIGLGLMGSTFARTLLERGYHVIGCDIAPERQKHLCSLGGLCVDTPQQVCGHADVVVLALLDSAVVEHVVEGPAGIASAVSLPGLIIDTSTGDPEATTALASRLARRNIDYVDATVSGNSAEVAARSAVFMVGGSEAAVRRAEPVLAALTERRFHVGPAGAGAKAKLATNLMLGLNRLVLAETLVFAESLGLDLSEVLKLLRATPAYSAAVDVKGPKMLAGDFTPVARLRQHAKDVALILLQAEREGVELPLTAVHQQLLRCAIDAGDGELDNSAVISELRRRKRNLV